LLDRTPRDCSQFALIGVGAMGPEIFALTLTEMSRLPKVLSAIE
jgi:hypothetical protein